MSGRVIIAWLLLTPPLWAAPKVIGARAAQPAVAGEMLKRPGQPAVIRDDRGQSVPAAQFDAIATTPPEPEPVRSPFMLQLTQEEQIIVEQYRCDGDRLAVDGPLGAFSIKWSQAFGLSRRAANVPLLHSDFTELPIGLMTNAGALLANEQFLSAPTSLRLHQPGAKARFDFTPNRKRAEVRFAFFDDGRQRPDWTWQARFKFGDKESVVLHGGWNTTYLSLRLTEGIPAGKLALQRRTGWRQCLFAFDDRQWRLTVDDAPMATSWHRGIELPITAVEWELHGADGAVDPPAVWFDDLTIVEPPAVVRRQITDPMQFDVLLGSGDQWFGQRLSGERGALQLIMRGNATATIPSNDLESIRFPESAPMPNLLTGEIGRVGLGEQGNLVVSLQSADEQHWEVVHPILGELRLPAPTVRHWTPLVVGERRIIDARVFHLGNKLAPKFDRPLPDGTQWKGHFTLDRVAPCQLTLWVKGLEGTGPNAPFAHLLKAGDLRTEVWLNDQRVDYLNRLLHDRPENHRRLKLDLPTKHLRVGPNQIELRQLPDPATNEFDEAEVLHWVIQQPASTTKQD